MGRNVVSAKLDIIFKKLFTDNRDLLQSFVAGLLELDPDSVGDIVVRNGELPPEDITGKFSRLDLNMTIDGVIVNVEIQMRDQSDFRDRTLFYWAKLYSSELKSGEDYSELKKTITINIINFNMFGDDNYHHEVNTVIKESGEIFSDKFKMHFFELRKVGKKPDPKNKRELWLQFINADSEEDFDMISQTNDPHIRKAVKVIFDMSEDTRIREIARAREKMMHDEASALKGARDEGITKGRTEERAAIKERLQKMGMSDEDICKALGE